MASAPGKWELRNHVQTAILQVEPITGMPVEEWLVSAYRDRDQPEYLRICIDRDRDWKARRQNGKLPDGAFLYIYTHFFSRYTHYLSSSSSWLNLAGLWALQLELELRPTHLHLES
jgi:hypothetical protein